MNRGNVMKKLILKLIQKYKKKRFETMEIERELKSELNESKMYMFHSEFTKALLSLEEEGKIQQIKSSGAYSIDGRIKKKYQIVGGKQTISEDEKTYIMTQFHPRLNVSSYLKDMTQFKKDQKYIKIISNFLDTKKEKEPSLSVNERSYRLFDDEKFLSSSEGSKVLNRLGMTFKDLHSFETFEPFFYYQMPVSRNGDVLIVENKDTFFSLKELMKNGINTWAGLRITMLIYGEGNKIVSSINFLNEVGVSKETPIYYYGDLDPEGIAIYHRTKSNTEYKVVPMEVFYKNLWENKKDIKVKKNQKWNSAAIEEFLSFFEKEWGSEVMVFLGNGNYVPQEATSIEILRRLADGFKKVV
jgi:hypothetical protein